MQLLLPLQAGSMQPRQGLPDGRPAAASRDASGCQAEKVCCQRPLLQQAIYCLP